MLSLRTIAQQSARGSLPSVLNRPTQQRDLKLDRLSYAPPADRTPNRWTQPTQSFTAPAREPVISLTEVRRQPQPPVNVSYGERPLFPASQLKTQIQQFRYQLFESWFVAAIYAAAIVAPVCLILGLRLMVEIGVMIAVIPYIKIVKPWLRSTKPYLPLLLLFLLVFYTDFTDSDKSVFTIGSLVYCTPAALFMLYYKWRVLTQNDIRLYTEPYGIVGIAKRSIVKTIHDILDLTFWKGILLSMLFSTLGAYSFVLIDLHRLHIHFLWMLMLSHLSLLFVLNVINQVDIWSDVSDKQPLRLDSEIPLSFWMLRLEDPAYQHEQDRSVKHINRLILRHKNIMHEKLNKGSFGQQWYWDLFVKYTGYALAQIDTTIGNCRSVILNSTEVIRERKSTMQDAFIYFRKLYQMSVVAWQVRKVQLEIRRTLPIYETLIKALSYSRSGVQREMLQQPTIILSRIRSIFESSLNIFQSEPDFHNALKKYTNYCLAVMEFLDDNDRNMRNLEDLVEQHLGQQTSMRGQVYYKHQ